MQMMEHELEVPVEQFLKFGALIGLENGECLIGWGEAEQIGYPREGHLNILCPDFFWQIELSWRTFSHSRRILKAELIRLLEPVSQRAKVAWLELDPRQFQQDFEGLQRLIAAGELRKGVPYTFAHGQAKLDVGLRAHMLCRVLQAPAPLTAYGIWQPEEGLLGATPELLFSLTPNQLQTMALAGTQRKDLSAAEFLKDRKQLHEHQIVAQDICARLKLFGEVTVGELQVLELPHLRHLITPITVRLERPVPIPAAAQLLHPTPALGSFPRESGLRWLRELNIQTPRHRYGAPFGVHYQDLQKCWVAIRNIQWWGEQIELGIGCGVVAESRFADEWEELRLKRDSITQLLGL